MPVLFREWDPVCLELRLLTMMPFTKTLHQHSRWIQPLFVNLNDRFTPRGGRRIIPWGSLRDWERRLGNFAFDPDVESLGMAVAESQMLMLPIGEIS
jgi:hypothetical protein